MSNRANVLPGNGIVVAAEYRAPVFAISLRVEHFCAAAEAIGATSKKTQKVQILSDYLRSRPPREAELSAIFFSGMAFPAWEEATLQVGGALLVRVVLEVSGNSELDLENAYRRTGDLGASAYELWLARRAKVPAKVSPLHRAEMPEEPHPGLAPAFVAETFRAVAAARGPAAKAGLLRKLFDRATALEAKYLVKIITGELRIGLKESLVEEAIAKAYEVSLEAVQRANMLLGDIGETLLRAADHSLETARMRLFHPIGFMLASPVDSAAEAFSFFPHAQVEDKYDGIRVQAHSASEQVRLFSRTRDEVTESFPELADPLRAFEAVILDGEVVAWDFRHGHALPFSELQKRLGRKTVTPALMQSVPVAYVVFDVLYAEGDLVIDRALRERGELLARIFHTAASQPAFRPRNGQVRTHDLQGKLAFEPAVFEENETPQKEPVVVLRAPVLRADSPHDLEQFFLHAQARGNEGLMIKDLDSRYSPGRRGRSWLKMKRELATLDVVVTSVEWGHGKRIGVLSDYTFAVRVPGSFSPSNEPATPAGEQLLNIGKAYSGLTDKEIAETTQWFLSHTVADHGFWREVKPEIVLEVAFNAVMRSDRHNSGYALRFPRILRLRPDKSVDEIDTLDRVREIYSKQQLPKTA